MPNIAFYLLSETDPKANIALACRLVEKAYRLKHQIYIHMANSTDAQSIDELLWTQREDSFIPHGLITENFSVVPPILIGYAAIPEHHNDILINLTPEIPSFYAKFQRVIEIIPNDEILRQQARQHYRIYREQGCQLESHNL